MSQDQQNHSLIIHDKFEDLFTQRYKALAQRYKVKKVLRQNSTQSIKLLIFYFLCGFWIFDTKKKKKMIKSNNVKTAKTDKVNNNQ